MAITTYTPSAASALYNAFTGVAFDDPKAYISVNGKRIDAKYFLQPVQNEILNLIKRQTAGGGAIQVRNATSGTLNAGPVNVNGHYGVDGTTGNPIFTVQAADATGNSKPAHALLTSSLANNTSGVAYYGGTFNSGIDTSGSSLGNPVYLAVGGGVTLTAPSGADQIVQIVGRVQTLANAVAGFGLVDGLVQLPTKMGTSWLQSGAVTFTQIGSGTNTSAAMIVGTGASLTTSGSGTITATACPFSGLTTSSNTSATLTVGTGGTLTFSGSGVVNASQISGANVPAGGGLNAGDLMYASNTNQWQNLPGNATTTRKFLQETGNGSIVTSLSWVALVVGDIPWTSITGDLSITSGGAATVTKINGATLGTTTATAGNLLIGSGSQWVSTAMSGDATITSGGVVTIAAGAVTTSKMDTTNNGGAVHQWENILDNPQGKVAQRPANGLSGGLSVVYGPCDRWKIGLTAGTGTITTSHTQDTAAPNGNSGYAMKMNITAVTSGTAVFRQYIEKKNAVKLLNRTAIFSVNVRHDFGSNVNFVLNMYPMTADDNGTLGSALVGGNLGSNQSVATGTSTTINSGAISISTNASHGFVVEIQVAVGTVASSKNIWVTDAQLQLGSTVTPCEERGYHEELQRCQRYFFSCGLENGAERICPGQCLSTTIAQVNVAFPVPMMKAPTLGSISDHTKFALFTSNGVLQAISASGISSNLMTTRNGHLACTVASGIVAGNATFLAKNSDATVPLTFDADF